MRSLSERERETAMTAHFPQARQRAARPPDGRMSASAGTQGGPPCGFGRGAGYFLAGPHYSLLVFGGKGNPSAGAGGVPLPQRSFIKGRGRDTGCTSAKSKRSMHEIASLFA